MQICRSISDNYSMEINKIAIFANLKRPMVSETISEMEQYFAQHKIELEVVPLKNTTDDNDIQPPCADLAVSLGGDGTVLTCASILENTEIPLLAVNLGTFGYLAEVPLTEYKEIFEDYKIGKSSVLERMRLSAVVYRNNKPVYETSALNEITVASATKAKIAKFSLTINGTLAANLRADGIILATPSGSTAYNLSAGGPILDAEIRSIIVNPICPFTMGARPLVISEKSVCRIDVPPQSGFLVLTSDGHHVFPLESEDYIIVHESKRQTFLVENKKRKFIEVLRCKLGWAGGFNA